MPFLIPLVAPLIGKAGLALGGAALAGSLFGKKKKKPKPEEQLRETALASSQFELDKQKKLFALAFPQLQSFLTGEGVGFDPTSLAQMNSQAIDTTATQFEGARRGTASELARRGLRTGSAPISGEGLRRTAELGATQAATTAGSLRDIAIRNALLKQENRFKALSLTSGFPANAASSIAAGASVPPPQGGILGSIFGSLGGALAGSLGKGLGDLILKKAG